MTIEDTTNDNRSEKDTEVAGDVVEPTEQTTPPLPPAGWEPYSPPPVAPSGWEPYSPPPRQVAPAGWEPYSPPPRQVVPSGWEPYSPPPRQVRPSGWEPYGPPPRQVAPTGWEPYSPPPVAPMGWEPYSPPVGQPEPVKANNGAGALAAKDGWTAGKAITNLWSSSTSPGVWIAVQGVGWKLLSPASDSGHSHLTLLAMLAKNYRLAVSYHEDARGQIDQLVV
ncbi:hypothetical protein SAMN05421630_10614 [Prauserella marina]|uniref:Uncharacterized protein n=1 Tax=Prauserella marina TaxID=530584 RepID=A0A1G6S7W3_9PSEU|nr:hypothetical protein [Prauserella marina]SDD12255.1 hypothetical protein SAMN05421630_10614 [Prauserella marina]